MMYFCSQGCSGEDLLMFDELSGNERLSIEEALRLGLRPLDINDIDMLTATDWVTDAGAAEQQLRLDHNIGGSDGSFSRPL